MNQPCEAEVAPQLFECFIEREQSGLPTDVLPSAIGALLAGKDLLRAAGHFPGSEWPEGWFKVPSTDCFHRCCEQTKYILEVYKFGDYWFEPMAFSPKTLKRWLSRLSKYPFAQVQAKRRCDWRIIVIRTQAKPCRDVGSKRS
jgi:hypothetical protein